MQSIFCVTFTACQSFEYILDSYCRDVLMTCIHAAQPPCHSCCVYGANRILSRACLRQYLRFYSIHYIATTTHTHCTHLIDFVPPPASARFASIPSLSIWKFLSTSNHSSIIVKRLVRASVHPNNKRNEPFQFAFSICDSAGGGVTDRNVRRNVRPCVELRRLRHIKNLNDFYDTNTNNNNATQN